MALVPSEEQKKLIEKNGYDYRYWLVQSEDSKQMVIIHKESKETQTLKK